MKKLILILIGILFFFTNTNFAQSQLKKAKHFTNFSKTIKTKRPKNFSQSKNSQLLAPAQSVNYDWDYSFLTWEYADSTLYQYNSNGQITDEINIYYGPNRRLLTTYDTKFRQISLLTQIWDASTNQLRDKYRQSFIYDSHDNLTQEIFDSYDWTLSQWKMTGGTQYIITYNSANQITSKTEQHYDNFNDFWNETDREINHIYNSSGLLTQVDLQYKNGNNWVNTYRDKYLYSLFLELIEIETDMWNGTVYAKHNRSNNITWYNWTGDQETSQIATLTGFIWGNPISNQWNEEFRLSATYDTFGGNVFTYETFVNSAWVNDERESDIYDTKSNPIGSKYELWNTSTNKWEFAWEDKQIHSYDALDNITETIWQEWSFYTANLENLRKSVYSDFKPVTGIKEQSEISGLLVSIYPNPIHNQFTIQINNTSKIKSQDLSLKIVDLNGKEVMQEKLSGNETLINKGSLDAGVYFYSVLDKTNVMATGKLVVE